MFIRRFSDSVKKSPNNSLHSYVKLLENKVLGMGPRFSWISKGLQHYQKPETLTILTAGGGFIGGCYGISKNRNDNGRRIDWTDRCIGAIGGIIKGGIIGLTAPISLPLITIGITSDKVDRSWSQYCQKIKEREGIKYSCCGGEHKYGCKNNIDY